MSSSANIFMFLCFFVFYVFYMLNVVFVSTVVSSVSSVVVCVVPVVVVACLVTCFVLFCMTVVNVCYRLSKCFHPENITIQNVLPIILALNVVMNVGDELCVDDIKLIEAIHCGHLQLALIVKKFKDLGSLSSYTKAKLMHDIEANPGPLVYSPELIYTLSTADVKKLVNKQNKTEMEVIMTLGIIDAMFESGQEGYDVSEMSKGPYNGFTYKLVKKELFGKDLVTTKNFATAYEHIKDEEQPKGKKGQGTGDGAQKPAKEKKDKRVLMFEQAEKVLKARKHWGFSFCLMLRNENIVNPKWAQTLANVALTNFKDSLDKFALLYTKTIAYDDGDSTLFDTTYQVFDKTELPGLKLSLMEYLQAMRSSGLDLTRWGIEANPGPRKFMRMFDDKNGLQSLDRLMSDHKLVEKAFHNKWSVHNGKRISDADLHRITELHRILAETDGCSKCDNMDVVTKWVNATNGCIYKLTTVVFPVDLSKVGKYYYQQGVNDYISLGGMEKFRAMLSVRLFISKMLWTMTARELLDYNTFLTTVVTRDRSLVLIYERIEDALQVQLNPENIKWDAEQRKWVRDLTKDGDVESNPGPVFEGYDAYTEEIAKKADDLVTTIAKPNSATLEMNLDSIGTFWSSYTGTASNPVYTTVYYPRPRCYNTYPEVYFSNTLGFGVGNVLPIGVQGGSFFRYTILPRESSEGRYGLTLSAGADNIKQASQDQNFEALFSAMRTSNSFVNARVSIAQVEYMFRNQLLAGTKISGEQMWITYFLYNIFYDSIPLIAQPIPDQRWEITGTEHTVTIRNPDPGVQFTWMNVEDFFYAYAGDAINGNLPALPVGWKNVSPTTTLIIPVDDALKGNMAVLSQWILLKMGTQWTGMWSNGTANCDFPNRPAQNIFTNDMEIYSTASNVIIPTPERVVLVFGSPLSPTSVITLFTQIIPYWNDRANPPAFQSVAVPGQGFVDSLDLYMRPQPNRSDLASRLKAYYNDKQEIQSALQKAIAATHFYTQNLPAFIGGGANADTSTVQTQSPTLNYRAAASAQGFVLPGAPTFVRNDGAVDERSMTRWIEKVGAGAAAVIIGGPPTTGAMAGTLWTMGMATNCFFQTQTVLADGDYSTNPAVNNGYLEMADNPKPIDVPSAQCYTYHSNFQTELIVAMRLGFFVPKDDAGFEFDSPVGIRNVYNYGVLSDAIAALMDDNLSEANVTMLHLGVRVSNFVDPAILNNNTQQLITDWWVARTDDNSSAYGAASIISPVVAKDLWWAPARYGGVLPATAGYAIHVLDARRNSLTYWNAPVRRIDKVTLNNLDIYKNGEEEVRDMWTKTFEWEVFPVALGNNLRKVATIKERLHLLPIMWYGMNHDVTNTTRSFGVFSVIQWPNVLAFGNTPVTIYPFALPEATDNARLIRYQNPKFVDLGLAISQLQTRQMLRLVTNNWNVFSLTSDATWSYFKHGVNSSIQPAGIFGNGTVVLDVRKRRTVKKQVKAPEAGNTILPGTEAGNE